MQLLSFLGAASCVAAATLDCQKLGIDGVFQDTQETSKLLNTPPTKTNNHVYFNPCKPIKNVEGCASDDHLCVVEEFDNNGEQVVRSIKSYGSAKNGARTILDTSLDSDSRLTVTLTYDGAEWGGQQLTIQAQIVCDPSATDPAFSIEADEDEHLEPVLRTSAICGRNITPTKPSPPPPSDGDNEKPSGGGHWGLVFWLLFVVFLAAAAYLGLVVYLNLQNSGRSAEILSDVNGIVKDLPYIIRDLLVKLVEKFRGRSATGYAAI